MHDLSYTLATIKTDVELNVTTGGLLGESQKDQLIEYFARYEFKRWLNEVINGADSMQTTEQPVKMEPVSGDLTDQSAVGNTLKKFKSIVQNMKTLLTQADLTHWIEKLNTAKLITVDTETDSLDYISANLSGYLFCS